MHKVVIADTSCLILFSKINAIFILKALYTEVIVTSDVATEFEEPLPDWIEIQDAKAENIEVFKKYNIGKGEISSLALAFELKNAVIILDDEKAKRIAKFYKLDVSGSLGIIIKAKQKGIITNVSEILNKIKSTNFYLPESLEHAILKIAGE